MQPARQQGIDRAIDWVSIQSRIPGGWAIG
jgi:hypothetical protein